MAMTGSKDGERGSYPEIVDALTRHGAQAKTDAQALYRRVAFNVLISNVDDHLRNHGFLWLGKAGWSLSPVYDLNPVPTDLKARVLTTKLIWTKAPARSTSSRPPRNIRPRPRRGARHHQGSRGRDGDLAGDREGGRRPARRNHPHGQRL